MRVVSIIVFLTLITFLILFDAAVVSYNLDDGVLVTLVGALLLMLGIQSGVLPPGRKS